MQCCTKIKSTTATLCNFQLCSYCHSVMVRLDLFLVSFRLFRHHYCGNLFQYIIETIKSLIDLECPDLLCVDGEVSRAALSSPHATGTGHHHQLVLLLNWNLLRGLGERRSRLGIVRYTLTLQSLLVFLY